VGEVESPVKSFAEEMFGSVSEVETLPGVSVEIIKTEDRLKEAAPTQVVKSAEKKAEVHKSSIA